MSARDVHPDEAGCPFPSAPELGDVWTCPDCGAVWRYGWECAECDRVRRRPGTAPASHHRVHSLGHRWRLAEWWVRVRQWWRRRQMRRWHQRLEPR